MQPFACYRAVLEKTNLLTVYATRRARKILQLKVYFCGYQNYNFI